MAYENDEQKEWFAVVRVSVHDYGQWRSEEQSDISPGAEFVGSKEECEAHILTLRDEAGPQFRYEARRVWLSQRPLVYERSREADMFM